MKPERKCFSCRKQIKGTNLFCKDCDKKPVKTSSTLIIFDKV